jgi:hypothetical protein
MARIAKRHREGEEHIPETYIQDLHDLHERAYLDAVAAGMWVLCIDVEGKSIEAIGDEIYQALQTTKFI